LKIMWPLGQTFSKKLTYVTRLTKTSLICVKIGLIGTF
jgi:hypothetical protein